MFNAVNKSSRDRMNFAKTDVPFDLCFEVVLAVTKVDACRPLLETAAQNATARHVPTGSERIT